MFTPSPDQLPHTGAALRAMRTGAGLSLSDLADRCNTTKSTISRFERGQRLISAELLARIARAIADELATKRGAA